jgi:uncharacterized protein (TIGR02118 family)
MSMKLVAVYNQPADQAAFDRHYEEIHTPLAKAVPGLSELRVTRMKKRLMGEADIYLVAEMIFPDQETFNAAMASEENKAAGADLGNFAKGRVTLFVANA